jgi:hypothetical protein
VEKRIDPATGKGFVGYDEGDRFVHYCEVCGIEAGHGFGVAVHLGERSRPKEVGRWFCSQHKPGVDPAPLAEAKPALNFNPQHEQWEWDCRTYDADGLMNPPGADGWVPWPCNRSKTASRWDGKTKSWMTPDEIYQRDHAGRGHGDRT